MPRRPSLRIVCIAAAALVLALGFAAPAHAQAFVPAQGDGTVSLLYQDQLFKYHYLPTAIDDIGPIYSRSLLVDVTYGVTDKMAVSVAVPWLNTRYTGPRPHPADPLNPGGGPNRLDDGTWHSTLQDFRFDVRYNVTRNLGNRGVVLTPFVGSIVPSHDYAYFSHAAFGRNLNEIQLGTSVAKLFEKGIPGLLVQGSYAYGFTEKVVDISHNRSLFSLEAAYFATPKLRLLALSSGQRTHGGIDFLAPPSLKSLGPVLYPHHDRIDRNNVLGLGGGASYSLTESMDVYGSLMHSVIQRNGHGLTRGLSLGLSWSFSTPRGGHRAAATNAENSLVRCLCEKGSK
jgi:hypothetical protein